MARILFDARVTLEAYPSGVSMFALKWLESLASCASEHALTVYTNRFKKSRSPNTTFSALQHLPIQHLSTHWPNKFLSLAWTVSHYPRLKPIKGFDLIHSPHINVIRAGETPRLVSMPDLAWVKFPEQLSLTDLLWHKMMALSARQATHFTANSNATKQDIMQTWGIESKRITVIYPGPPDQIEPYAFPACRYASCLKPKRYFVFIGNRQPRKNLLRLMEAFKQVLASPTLNDYKLVIIGRRSHQDNQLLERISKLGLNSAILMTGYVDERTKQTLLAHAAGLVFPSLYEGFGLPLLEAMQARVPIITSQVSAMPEVAGNAALYVDPYHSATIAHAMLQLAQNPALQKQLVLRGLTQLQAFSWQQTARQTLALYHFLVR